MASKKFLFYKKLKEFTLILMWLIQQLIQQGFGCIKQAVSIGMVDDTDESFGRVMSEALQKCLTSSYHTGELFRRRLELGLVWVLIHHYWWMLHPVVVMWPTKNEWV